MILNYKKRNRLNFKFKIQRRYLPVLFLRRLLRRIKQVYLCVIIISYVPIKTLHHKIIILMIDSHKEVTHPCFDSHSVHKILPKGFLIIQRILNQINRQAKIYIWSQFIRSPLLSFRMRIRYENTHIRQSNIIVLYKDLINTRSNKRTIKWLVFHCNVHDVQFQLLV